VNNWKSCQGFLTALFPTTVTSAVNELIRDGLVCESGTGVSSGGRKPILVQFSPDNKFLIGVSIDNSSISIAEMNLEATVKRKQDFAVHSMTGDAVVAFILESIAAFLQPYGDLSACVGVSVIAPGIVDANTGVIRYNAKLKLRDVPLKQLVEERFGLKVWVDNDANAIALAESNFGNYHHATNLLYITLGDGLGAGIVVNGTVMRGACGGAGEFGHTSIDRSGMRCDCGNAGCLENYVSWPAIYSRILSSITRGKQTMILDLAGGDITRISLPIFLRAAERNDELAQAIVEEVAAYLAAGIVNLVNLFNPEVVILGGYIAQNNQLLIEKVSEQVMEHALNILTKGLEIASTSFGEDFHVKGAAALIMQDLFHFSM